MSENQSWVKEGGYLKCGCRGSVVRGRGIIKSSTTEGGNLELGCQIERGAGDRQVKSPDEFSTRMENWVIKTDHCFLVD